MSEFTLRSRDGGASLSLSWESRDHWIALLSGPGVTAQRRVVAFTPRGDFRALFEEMAREWRGWEGTKGWESLEGELKFACRSDGLGHVAIVVDLVTDRMCEWRVRGSLVVEAGQLDAMAKAASDFLEGGKYPPA